MTPLLPSLFSPRNCADSRLLRITVRHLVLAMRRHLALHAANGALTAARVSPESA
jgi:hypothetical protein